LTGLGVPATVSGLWWAVAESGEMPCTPNAGAWMGGRPASRSWGSTAPCWS